MSRQTQTKVTLQDILAKKMAREDAKREGFSIYVECLNGELDFSYPEDSDIIEFMNNVSDNFGDLAIAYTPLIYKNCKIFQSEKTVAEFEVTDPYDIVRQTFTPKEIVQIGTDISFMLNSKGSINQVKN